MTKAERHLLCFGLGYSARRLALRLSKDGWLISGTARMPQGVEAIREAGWNGLLFDGQGDSPAVRAVLPEVTHVLVSVPPDAGGDPALSWHRQDIAAAPKLVWIGYLSTVAVYGDCGGCWVDETALTQPVSARGKRRLAAEQDWLSLRTSGRRVEVFRLPGIYGPGRSAIENVRAGTARRIVKAGQYFNRVHVEDIAGVLATAIDTPTSHSIFNLTDDEPSPPQDPVAFAAEVLGLPVPAAIPFETADMTPMARSFYGESKRVSNAQMKSALGYRLQYPSYREGLRAIAAAAR